MTPLVHALLFLIVCALTTVVVECLYWACFRPYRTAEFLTWCATVNFVSNITLNVTLGALPPSPHGLLSGKVLVGEALVVIFEYLMFLMVVHGDRGRLFMLTFLANVITYSIGFLL